MIKNDNISLFCNMPVFNKNGLEARKKIKEHENYPRLFHSYDFQALLLILVWACLE